MGWLGAVELGAGLVVLLVVLVPVGLYLRRRFLSQSSATFDCALRLHLRGTSHGWATGMARYEGDELQWIRIFSFDLGPRVTLRRDQTRWVGTRPASPQEAVLMFSGDEIVQLESVASGSPRTWELAMGREAATGLMSWLEAAPPGGDAYSGLAPVVED